MDMRSALLLLHVLVASTVVAQSPGALSLDGISGYVDAVDAGDLTINGPTTIECWIRITAYPTNPSEIINKRDRTSGLFRGFTLHLQSGFVELAFWEAGNASGLPVQQVSVPWSLVPLATWTHLAGVFDAAAITLYVNGQVAGTTAWTGSLAPSSVSPLRIGRDAEAPAHNPSTYFGGLLDDVRYWSTARTQAQIQSAMHQEIDGEPGLLASWHFNFAAADSTGSHHTDWFGGATFAASSAPVFPVPGIRFVDIAAASSGNGTAVAPFTSIQAAITAAAPGDTVSVAPGTYTESVDFLGKAIAVRSRDGALATTIDGGGSGRTVTFDSAETANAVLEGFTITGGNATFDGTSYSNYGGGILCFGASPTIVTCIVRNNAASDAGGGIAVVGSSPIIASCFLKDNAAAGGGGNLWVSGTAAPLIEGCVLAGGNAYSGGGVAVYSNAPGEGALPTMVNCTVHGNTSTAGQGGGITVQQANTLFLRNTIVWANQPPAFWTAGPAASGSVDAAYCDLEAPATFAAACLAVDPVLESGSFRLTEASPCIDAGNATFMSSATADLDGDARVLGAAIDIGADEYAPQLGPCAAGNVGADSGGPFDVLFVNGSTGGLPRRVDVPLSASFTIAVAQPVTNPVPALFAIVGFIGVPAASEATVLPFGIGNLCFGSPHFGYPGTFVLANSFDPLDQQALLPSTFAPWSVSIAGVPFPFTFTLQGIVFENPGHVRVMNGLIVSIQ
jgi:hypothetical protein